MVPWLINRHGASWQPHLERWPPSGSSTYQNSLAEPIRQSFDPEPTAPVPQGSRRLDQQGASVRSEGEVPVPVQPRCCQPQRVDWQRDSSASPAKPQSEVGSVARRRGHRHQINPPLKHHLHEYWRDCKSDEPAARRDVASDSNRNISSTRKLHRK